MAKKKKVILSDWAYSTKLECGKSNKDISFTYKVENGIKVKAICADAWIYTNNPDGYEVSIKAVIKLNNEIIFESQVETTTQGTAWSSCVYEFSELVEDGFITIETVGNNFRKGLNLSLQGYINAK